MTSSDDETGPERSRHRSSEPRHSRWRRRHDDAEVGELDPEDVAKLIQRTARPERETPVAEGSETVQRPSEDDSADRRVFSDALERGLADPAPAKRHLLPRRRHEDEEPATSRQEDSDLETRLRAAEERAEEYTARLRHAHEDLTAAEDRARQLAEELAARDAEDKRRSTMLAAERTGVEERVRALTDSLESAAEERARLERLVADQARMLEEVQDERARAEEQIERSAEQLRQVQAELERAEERARTLATESAARATEHSERVRALVAEREAAEEEVRSLTERIAAVAGDDDRDQRAAQEREALELALAQAVRLADEARTARAKAEATAAEYAARLEQAGSESESGAEVTGLAAALAAAEERIRALTDDATERNTQHAERIDALLADLEAAEQAAQESRRVAQQAEARMFEAQAEARLSDEQRGEALAEAHRALAEAHARADEEAQARAVAEARIGALEQRLDEAHVLPVFSPVESGNAESEPLEPEPEEAVPAEDPEPWFAEQPDVEEEPEVEPESEVEEPEAEVPEPEVEVEVQEPEPEPAVEVAEPEPVPAPAPRSARTARGANATYDSRRGSGLIGTLAGLIALACAAAVGWLAYQGTMLDQVNVSLGLTIAAVLALAVALRRRAQSSEVHLERGTLRLRFGDTQHTFYLNSPSTRVEMSGTPGDRDWRMQVLRRGMAPVTIDAKDVDPVAFTEALRHWHPSV